MANLNISNLGIYTLLIVALILFIALRLLTWLFPLIITKTERRKIALRYKSLCELLIWVLFLLWAVQFLYTSNQPFAYALFAILFLIVAYSAWVGLKDIIAGAFLKATHKLSINELITVGDYSGKIVGFDHSNLLLETALGETLYIPYSSLLGKVIVKMQPAESIHRHSFKFEVDKAHSTREDTEKIRGFILTMPWASLKKEPQIRYVTETTSDKQIIEVTLYSIEKEHFQDMERLIKEKFSTSQD
ncbi:MAG TPA: mechanosensitive ion channel [Bacteroidales bacterium]|nr:MAG: Mechanosensitive ion channel [Bacteroidetes bacterium ADurb.Bin041]HNV50414.1 mechanosensitive ion channel [Bacteroidales bacterium]HPW42477.1 mechanosensitive ion channel [Bacteroidales bacterium]